MSETPPPEEDPRDAEHERQQRAAMKAVERMSKLLASQKAHHGSEDLMRQIGSLKRQNALLTQILVIVIIWLGLAIGAVSSFVSPASFEAWREGIAIQLIRRTKQTNVMSLYTRRTFGYLCERAFFEIPNTVFAALKSPTVVCAGLLLSFPVAALLRAASPYQCDVLLALACLLVGQLLCLGDDLQLSIAPQMANAGAFCFMIGFAVLTIPALLRKLHKPTPWSQYRAQILRALRAGIERPENTGEGTPAYEPPPSPPGIQDGVMKRLWLRFVLSQKHRRHTCTSWEFGVSALLNGAVYMVDTLIAHD